MGLNIKNERTHALVRELAERTGQSQTSAVEEAVRLRLEELNRPGPTESRFDVHERARRRAAIEWILDEFEEATTVQQRAAMVNHGDWLYDETGLPA